MTVTINLADHFQNVIANALGLPKNELFDADGQGEILLDGANLQLQTYAQDDAQVLVLLADLGRIAVDQRMAVYQMMLVANSGWRELAGGALCTDEAGGKALLRLRLDLKTCQDTVLVQWLQAFIRAAEQWAARLLLMSQKDLETSDEMPVLEGEALQSYLYVNRV